MRSGAQTLVLLAAPVTGSILRTLTAGPARQTELRRAAGSPAQTTLRAQLQRLEEIGAVERHRRDRFPGALVCELTPAGRELGLVLDALERWLQAAPAGPLSLAESPARAAVKALAEGWSTTMLRVLASGPRSLTELDGLIASISYPSLERRLVALRLAGLVEPVAAMNGSRRTPYAVTRWLRLGLAPLAVACRWERRNRSTETPAITRIDIETACLLAVPTLDRRDGGISGSFRFAVETVAGRAKGSVGVVFGIENGALGSCTTSLEGPVDAWALGSAPAWLDAVIDLDLDRIELGGDAGLARAAIESLHTEIFQVPVAPLQGTVT